VTDRRGWRYIAQRLDGINSEEFIDMDLPLSDVNIEQVLTGVNSLTGTISPEVARLKTPDGRPLLEEWGCAIYAEKDGHIYGGGILERSAPNGPDLQLECIGFAGYPKEQPYLDSKFFIEEDPLNIFRHIWTYLQGQPGQNLFLNVDSILSGLKIGTELQQVEFDTVSGPVSFESGPYKLAYYQTHDLLDNLTDLASDTPFDWREHHYWSGETIAHRLELGYPTLGSRRTDLRFVIGENIFESPQVTLEGDEYASDVLLLGAGEGPTMIRGAAHRPTDRLRRTAVVSDPNIRSLTAAQKGAEREVAARVDTDQITDFVAIHHPNAPTGAVQVGDEIRLEGKTGWVDVDMWVRVLSTSISPDESDNMTLSVVPSSRIAA
jgi:hypothetical protein